MFVAQVNGRISDGGWDVPGTVQLGQGPLQASVVRPAVFPYVLIGHGKHIDEFEVEYVPGLQSTQLDIPAWIHEPAGQDVGVADDDGADAQTVSAVALQFVVILVVQVLQGVQGAKPVEE